MKTQGRHGEVAAQIYTDISERFAAGMKLSALPREADRIRRDLTIEEFWPHKGMLVFKFSGVDSMSEAETLIGCELQVPQSQRSELQSGWNYVSDLVGCAVFDGDREVGRIEDVQFGAGEAPLLIVRKSGQLIEIPFAEAYLKAMDVKAKRLDMNLPDGLLDVNAPLTADEKKEQSAGRKKH